MCREIIPHHLTIFHDKANALKLGDVSEGIAGNCDQVGKFARLDGANAILPAQHFGGITGYGANHVKCRHSCGTEIEQGGDTGLAAGLSGPEPAHVGSGGKLHPRFQQSLDQLVASCRVNSTF